MRVQPQPPQPGSDSHLALTAPLTVGDLLDRAFRLYRSRFGLFLLTGAVLLIPIAIVSGFFLERFFANYLQTFEVLMREPPGTEFYPFAYFSVLFGDSANMILVSLLIAAAGAIVSLSLTAQAAEALRDGSLPFMAGLRRGVRRFLPYVGMVVVQFAAIAAAAVVVLAPLVLVGIALVAGGAPFARAGEGGIFATFGIVGLAICGYALAFVLLVLAPITYLSARWLVAPVVLVVEGAGPIDALRRSWRLSQDNVLRMVGFLVLLYILETILMSPVVALQFATVMLMPPSAANALMLSLPTISSSLISVIVLPFFVAAVVLLYYDLRIRGRTTT